MIDPSSSSCIGIKAHLQAHLALEESGGLQSPGHSLYNLRKRSKQFAKVNIGIPIVRTLALVAFMGGVLGI